MMQSTKNTTTTLQRGDSYEGGLYVGTSRAGVEWVSRRGAEEFARLCERFDQREGKPTPARRVKLTGCSAQVIELADACATTGAEAGLDYCQAATVRATVIEAAPEFFGDLAERLRDAALDWLSGDRTIEEANCEIDWRFAEAAGKRVAQSLRRWGARCERLAN